MPRLTRTLLILVLLPLCGGLAHATSLNLLDGLPDITTQFDGVSYNSLTSTLTITGKATSIQTLASTPACSASGGCFITDNPFIGNNGSFNFNFEILAQVNSSGNLVAGTDTLTVMGAVGSLGGISGTLLQGNITAFGIGNGSGNPYEFLVKDTGGLLDSYFPNGLGGMLGVIVSPQTGSSFSTNFTGNFSAGYTGLGDIGANTPEPASLLLLLSGGGLLGVLRKRFSKGASAA